MALKKTILLYALVLAAAVFALEWLEYQKLMRSLRTEFYVFLIAVGFAVLGAWVGIRLTQRGGRNTVSDHENVQQAMGITDREFEVLKLLYEGQSTKELARSLGVSPNTIKTHLANLYGKLGVERRTQAVRMGRKVGLLS